MAQKPDPLQLLFGHEADLPLDELIAHHNIEIAPVVADVEDGPVVGNVFPPLHLKGGAVSQKIKRKACCTSQRELFAFASGLNFR